jgi:hypothetical protein
MIQQNENENRATSPVDPKILEDFRCRPEAGLYQGSNNNDRTRLFRIQPANKRLLFKYFQTFF